MPHVVRLATGLAAAAFALPAAAQTQNGEALYRQQCAACHALAPGSAKMGPSLNGVVGRKAAALPGYAFSPGLKAIGVTGDKRIAVLPKVPTFAEQGIKDDVFRTVGWIAMAAPGGTPKAVIQRLADEIKAACALPEVRKRVEDIGFEAVGRGPDEFNAIAKADAQVWSRLVKQTGASLD